MTFRLAGNARALAAVQRSLQRPFPPHSYVFAGPARTGKATLALQLAQALNCARGGGARHDAPLLADSKAVTTAADGPCGECDSCRRIAAGIHSDVVTLTIDRSEDLNRKMISIDQVRDAERSVALAPYEGRIRVIIVDPADALSEDAQNAFLKTLEEPPPHAVFVLITTREDALLPTVRSRCQRVEFRLAAAAEIGAALAEESVESERASLLARLARGRPGWALAMARDPAALERRTEALEQAQALAAMPLADRMDLAERLTDEWRKDHDVLLERLDEWLGWWRDVMLVQNGVPDAIGNSDHAETLAEEAKNVDAQAVVAFVGALQDARLHLAVNVQPRLALENLMLKAPSGLIHAGRP